MSKRSRDRRRERQRKQRDRWPDPGRRCAPTGDHPIEAQMQNTNTASRAAKRAGTEPRGAIHGEHHEV
jgi:hypothetical protein